MHKALLVATLAVAPVLALAAPAQANPLPQLPDPTNCHEVQEFFHIQNVMACDWPQNG